MGKRKGGGRTMRNDFKQPLPNVWKAPRGGEDEGGPGGAARSGYDKFDMKNEAMFEYYKARAVVRTKCGACK